MSRKIAFLERACATLGLRLESSAIIALSNGVIIAAPVVRDLGAPKGTVVLDDAGEALRLGADLMSSGYACSAFGEPGAEESFNLQSYRDMFADWGWFGIPEQKPAWMDTPTGAEPHPARTS